MITARLPRGVLTSQRHSPEIGREESTVVSLAFYVRPSLVVAAWALAAAWAVQAVLTDRGLRRLPSLLDPALPSFPPPATSIAVVVPACNEQQGIAACLRSLLEQDWPDFHIIAVDDRSLDATGEIMDTLGRQYPDRLTVLHVTSLPAGWLGKTHAMAWAARHAKTVLNPKWLLFTDGDVLFHPECLRRSLAVAEAQRADHFVTVPTAIVHTAGEGVLMAFLQVVGLWGARLWKVEDPSARDAIGIGAFNLMRTSAYDQLGGFESLRLQVLEDLALARLVKDSGLRQRVALAPQYVRIHWAPGLRGVLNTMTKNLFAIFGFRLFLMTVASCSLAALCLGPYLGLLWAPTRPPSFIALIAIASLYRTTIHYLSKFSMINFLVFPASMILLLYAILRSVTVTLVNGGVHWRGTFYPVKELRTAAVRLR